jgi:hypothetical protein
MQRKALEALRAQDPGMAADIEFFDSHRDRKIRIREPFPEERDAEFATLGPHAGHRRRIIAYRTYHPALPLARIPFLLFADETIEDTDRVLLPILREVMEDAAARYGISR